MAPRDAYLPICVTFLIIDGVAVGLRFWARGIKHAIGYDDIMMAMSLVGFIIFSVLELEAVRYGIGATAMEESFDIIKAAMFFTIAQIVYIITTGISKIGVALVLFRLASGADMKVVRSILIATTVVLGLWCLVTTLVFALQCRPLSVAWGIGEGSCISSKVIGQTALAFSVVDMTMSWFYALLPIYMLHNTHLRFKLKLTILILLGLGGLSSIATIIRLKFVIQVTNMSSDRGLANPDIVPVTVEGTLYSIIEIGLSILAASLTALRPLLKKLPCFSDISSGGRTTSKGFGSINTFGNNSQLNKAPAYRLDDRHVNVSDADSQENIIPAQPKAIIKRTEIELSHLPRGVESRSGGGLGGEQREREYW